VSEGALVVQEIVAPVLVMPAALVAEITGGGAEQVLLASLEKPLSTLEVLYAVTAK
jgi:hypothetical protein